MEASPTYRSPDQHPVAAKMLSAQPDAVLCRLAARGNIGAYDTLYQRYHQPVFAFIFHLLGRADGREDAEDIAQDTFTRAFAGIERKSVDGSFKAWLFTIARNRTFDTIRARKQQIVSLDAETSVPPPAPQAEQPPERAEQRAELAWLVGAVSALPERQREALLMREMGGLSHESIATHLGTTVSAAKKLISRGRDGIGDAAAAGGYGGVTRRRLGRDLALAAPIVPITATLGSLGVTAGIGGAAAGGAVVGGAAVGGGAIAGGKVAATAMTVLAIGGGAVAVEHKSNSGDRSVEAARPPAMTRGPAGSDVARGKGRAAGRSGEDHPGGDDRGGHSGGGADDVAVEDRGPRTEAGDARGGKASSGRSGSPTIDDDGGRRGSGSGNSGSGSGSGSGRRGGTDDAAAPPPSGTPLESGGGDDGGVSGHGERSGKGGGSGSSSGSGGEQEDD
ncbi:MAG: RNA polymerase sigma factor [Solirubrobacterales bacterium]